MNYNDSLLLLQFNIRYIEYRNHKDMAKNTTSEDGGGKSHFVFEPLTYLCFRGASRIQGEWQSESYRDNEPLNDSESGPDNSKNNTDRNEIRSKDDGDVSSLRERLADAKLSIYIFYILLTRGRHTLQRTVKHEEGSSETKVVHGRSNKVAPIEATHKLDEDTERVKEIRVDAYHRFSCVFQDTHFGGEESARRYFCRHYKFFRLLFIAIATTPVAAMGACTSDPNSQWIGILQALFEMLGHSLHISYLALFQPLRDRYIEILTYFRNLILN